MMRERSVEFMIFALCGGDERTVRLAGLLLADGHGVRAWALEDAPLPEGVRRFESASECCAAADCVVLPMPLSSRRGLLNAPYSPEPRCLMELFPAIEPDIPVLAGVVGESARQLAEESGLELADYGALESFRAANSLATAEGAIGVLLRETETVLCSRRALIIGAGRISRALAPRLAALGMRVTVASRGADKRAWYAAMGFSVCDTGLIRAALPAVDIVINTAPALTLTASRLTELGENALVLDLASAPGGVDFDAARAFGIRAMSAPGLPGKWSPESAAAAVRDAIYAILGDERF